MSTNFAKLSAAGSEGFTLVEIIVSTALFVVVVSALIGLYIQAIELGRSADTTRNAAENGRDLSEYLAKEIRNGTVDFGDSGAVQSPCVGSPSSATPQGQASLALLDVDGDHLCIYLGDASSGSPGNPAYDVSGKYLYVIKNSEPAQLLNSPGLAIKNFKVYILPTSDPASGSSQEETVSVIGSVSAVSGSPNSATPQYAAVIPLDITISIPDYAYAPAGSAPTPTPTPSPCGSYTVQDSHGLTYGTVLGADGNCWLDRNIGATEVASSAADAASYGYYYQWGRLSDGHELPTSGMTSTLSSTSTPGNSSFILAPSTPYDWLSPQNGNLWQGDSGTNNPCPTGFALPTQAQWATLATDEGITNSATAFSSSLKLPVAGYRSFSSGVLANQGSNGYYWSSTVNGSYSYRLGFTSSGVTPATSTDRAYGFSIRCVND